jgi:hypothetical protein
MKNTMRKNFPGYYQPPANAFVQMWESGIFAFDANVLLDLFRYSSDTTNSLLSILEQLIERIWLPYQAAFEYHRNLHAVIESQAKSYNETVSQVNNLLKKFDSKKTIHSLIRHCMKKFNRFSMS